jgi:hypothetical protein
VKRARLIAAQVIATLLFVTSVSIATSPSWISWAVPLVLLLLIVVNSIWFTRFVAWLIFAGAFFALLSVLSAFTLRWRLEKGFQPAPFYRSLGMYAAMVYASLGQIKMNARVYQGRSS